MRLSQRIMVKTHGCMWCPTVEVTLSGSGPAYLVGRSCINVATHWRQKVTASCCQSARQFVETSVCEAYEMLSSALSFNSFMVVSSSLKHWIDAGRQNRNTAGATWSVASAIVTE